MGRPRILVIDDEQALRESIADTLRMDGHDVQTAADGEAGLELIGRNPSDVIFCDLLMPNMDGRAFYEEIRRDYPQVLRRIVLITALAHSPSDGHFLRDIGAPVLEKPFTIQQLRQVVTRMTGSARHAVR